MSVMPNNQQQQQQVNEENNLFPASYLLCLRHIYKYTCTYMYHYFEWHKCVKILRNKNVPLL